MHGKTAYILGIIAFIALSVTIFNYLRQTPASTEILGEVSIPTTPTAPQVYDTPAPPQRDIADTLQDSPTTTTTLPAETLPTAPPTPTSIRPTALPYQTPELATSVAGSISKNTYTSLEANTLYKISLPNIPSESMVISWPSTSWSVRWATDAITSLDHLVPLPIDTEGDEPLTTTATLHSGLLSVPTSRVIYLYSPIALSTVTFSFIRPAEDSVLLSTQATGVYNSDAGASYTARGLVSRDEWGANPGSWDGNSSADIDSESRLIWYPVYYRTARIVVHHTATAPNASTPAAAVRAIYMYHSYIRGWGDIGYNFLIDQNGTVYQGKLGGDGAMGYHAFGAANKISLSISLIGDFTYNPPPSLQKENLVRLLAEKSAFYNFTLKYSDGSTSKWRDPSYTLFGHRGTYSWNSGSNSWSINATGCPGNELVELLPTFAGNAEIYKSTHYTELKRVVAETEQSFTAPHEEGVIVVKYNVPESTAPEVITSYLPKFSGITSYTISGNTVTIPIVSSVVTHPDSSTEYLVPPMGWQGYDEDTPEFSTFSSLFVLNGPEDRAKVLLKIFKLDTRVLAADIVHNVPIVD